MKYVTLGRTGRQVSRIALGTWQLSGSWGQVERADGIATVRTAVENGVNFFDTAHAYGFGAAEEMLGDALRSDLRDRRDEVVLVTKGGVRRTPSGPVRDSSPEFLREGLEASLRALGVDHVDVFLLHWPDEATPMEEIAAAVDGFIEDGKVRHLGASNFDREQLERISAMTEISVLQPAYSLLRRGIESSVLPYCQEHDLGVFVYGTLAHGLLAGRFTAESSFADGDWRAKSPVFQGESFQRNVAMVERLRAYATERGVSLAELATAWSLAKPGVHSAIVGSKSPEQIATAVQAGTLDLSPEQVQEIEVIVADGVPIGGPSPEGGVAE